MLSQLSGELDFWQAVQQTSVQQNTEAQRESESLAKRASFEVKIE